MELVEAAGQFTHLGGFHKATIKGLHYDMFVIFLEVVLLGSPVLLIITTCLFVFNELEGFGRWFWVVIVLLCVSILYRLVLVLFTICGVGASDTRDDGEQLTIVLESPVS